MPGTRTAPTVDGTPNRKEVAIKYIDYTGDKRSVNILVDIALALDAVIETLVVNTALITNASIYEVQVKYVYAGPIQASNAIEEVWENVSDNVVLQLKNDDGTASSRNYLPSPINAIFLEGTDSIDTADAAFLSWLNSSLATMVDGQAAVGVRFSKRSDINPQQRL